MPERAGVNPHRLWPGGEVCVQCRRQWPCPDANPIYGSLVEAVGEDAAVSVRLWLSDVVDAHSICVDEGTANERVIPPSCAWLLEAISG